MDGRRLVGVVPDAVIQEIRDRSDIVEIVGGYVALKKSGRGFLGLCPFHQEKTPSFHVNPERGIYHCFGCGTTGDAFRFLMEHDHLSFPQAIEQLAQRAGIALTFTQAEKSAAADHDRLYRAHEIAAKLYRKTLESNEGETAREEIARRRFPAEIVAEYRLGAAPDSWDRLIAAARREGIDGESLVRAGLAVRRESGTGHYDRFRGRLMFPIETAGPRVIAFGGRILGEGEPKYLNSPETSLFRKRKTLYGLPQASAALREEKAAILVEGYMDVLALASAGFRNALGALGTAFTPEHAAALARIVPRVVVVFDADDAGDKAMLASAAPLLAAGLDVRVITLPRGEDPDSFIRKSGAEAFRALLEKSRTVMDALLGDEAYESAPSRDRAVRRALAALAELRDPLRQQVYLQEIHEKTGVPKEVLASRLEQDRGKPRPEREPFSRDEDGPKRRIAPARRIDAHDQTFLGLVLHDAQLQESLLDQFGPDQFDDPVVQRIVSMMMQLRTSGSAFSVGSVLDALAGDEEARSLVGMVAVSETIGLKSEQQAFDCARRIEIRSLRSQSEELLKNIRKANAAGDEPRRKEAEAQYFELRQRLETLNRRNSAGELTPPGRAIC
jgi:DNA primase